MSKFEYPPIPPTSIEDPFWQQYERTITPINPPDVKPEEVKLCPFRKRIYSMRGDSIQTWNVITDKAEFFEEEFQFCLKDKCALWDTYYNHCGVRNK